MTQVAAHTVMLSIDGREVVVPTGTLIIRAAEQVGIEIPRFCDHPLLEPVAACRQCYVSIEGQRKLMTSCSTPVADGMVVHTQFTSDEVKEAQEAVLEFLLINHPLDCQVCDRGGECPLQDQALAFGPGESRYVEAKRTYRKPLPLSPLVYLDRERCVLCQRCTRFCDEISGDRFITLFDRGAAEQIAISPGEDFASPFSGNTIQVCPVGALTASTYRFAARPFDLRRGDSVCTHCAAGCNLEVQLRNGRVVRNLARDNLDVNDAWLCDKGRFAFAFADRTDRLATPMLRERGLEPVPFDEAFSAIAAWCSGGTVAFLAGGRLSDEDAYALSRFARTVVGTNDVDHRPGGPSDVPLEVDAARSARMPVTYGDVERAKAILVVGLDAEQELPILHLRIRKAARLGAKVFVVHPRRTQLHDVAEHLLVRPGDEADLLSRLRPSGESEAPTPGSPSARIAEVLREAGDALVVLSGPRLAETEGAVAAAAALAGSLGGRFAHLCRRSGDGGALAAGLQPDLLPGGRPVADDAARAEVEGLWGADLPAEPGRDTAAILAAAANRELDVMFLIGTDPLRDFPGAALARRALENVPYKVVIDIADHGMSIYADAMLPAAASIEKDATYTDWEGRHQRVEPVRDPQGLARPDWQLLQELSVAMGHDMGLATLDALRAEMAGLHDATGDAAAAARRRRPSPTATDHGAPPERDLLLFTYPLLIDEGRQLDGAGPLKQAQEEPAFVEIHPLDAERLGVTDGAPATLTTEAGSATVPARVTDGIAPGCAFVPWNNPGLAANTLLSGARTASVSLTKAAVEVTA